MFHADQDTDFAGKQAQALVPCARSPGIPVVGSPMSNTFARKRKCASSQRPCALKRLHDAVNRNMSWTALICVPLFVSGIGCTAQSAGQRAQLQTYRELTDGKATVKRYPQDARSETSPLPYPDTWSTEDLVEQVLSRNPGIDAARHAWRSTIDAIDTARRISDPQLSIALAPLSVLDASASVGQTWRLDQSFPLPALLDARNQGAVARAQQDEAVFRQIQTELSHQARHLWIERWEIVQSLALIDHHESRFEELKRSVSAALETGKASLQAPLRIERNLAEMEKERGGLLRRKQMLEARINGLLHRPPKETLPQAALPSVPDVWQPEQTSKHDLTQHPVMLWFAANEDAALAAENIARAEFLPQLAFSAQYSTMFMQPGHQWMLGAGVQLPLSWRERTAKLESALSTRERRQYESLEAEDQISVAVHSAQLKGEEAWQRWRLYQDRLIPTTQAEADAARTGFETGRASFLEWVRAENELQNMELSMAKAQADLHRASADALLAAGRSGSTTTSVFVPQASNTAGEVTP